MNCSILDYGARQTDILQTEIIQKAIDDCFLAGGGTVSIPKGIFRTGGIRLRSNVTLYLEKGAILEGSSDPQDYDAYLDDKIEPISEEEKARFFEKTRSADPYSRWSNGLIKAVYAKNIAVIAEEFTYIDGMACYDPEGEEHYRGPHPISFWFCEDVTLKGYTVRRSGNWGHAIFCSKNITISDVTVLGGHDGIDLRTCDNILIENCYVDTGDDAIAGFDNNDVIVRNCSLGSSKAIFRFAGNNVLIDNIKTTDQGSFGFRGSLSDADKAASKMTTEKDDRQTTNGFLYYFDSRAQKRKPQCNITVQNCEFSQLDRIFRLNWNENYVWCNTLCLTQIKFKNCKFNNVKMPLYIHADPEDPMVFEMEDCEVTAKKGFEDIDFGVGIDFSEIRLKNIKLNNFQNPRFVKKTNGIVNIENSAQISVTEELIENTKFSNLVV